MITNEEYMEVSVLRKRGGSLREISVETGLAVNTIRKYLKAGPPAARIVVRRGSQLDDYDRYLRERIEAARPDWIPATVLHREITGLGYRGSLRILQVRLKALRPVARPDPDLGCLAATPAPTAAQPELLAECERLNLR